MENPLVDFETNAKGTLCVLEKARKDDAKVVFASSAAVYGNPTQSFQLRKTMVFTHSHAMAYPKLLAKNTAKCTVNNTA